MKNEQQMPERSSKSEDVTIEAALPDMFPIPHFEEIKNLLEERLQKGVETYGTRLYTHNGRDSYRDAVEEFADAVLYLTQAQLENRKEKNIVAVKQCALIALSLLLEK